jgi:CRP-like cAMP-binding protein
MSTDKDKIAVFLARTPPFAGEPAADIAALSSVSSLHRFPPGARVFAEGEPAAASWLVREGRVRILIFAGGTRTLQAESLGPGELFGLYCRLGSRLPYPCTALADGPLSAVRLPDKAFEALARRNPSVARCTAEGCAGRMRSMSGLVRFGRQSVGARIAATLLALRTRLGDEIPATRHELSTWVGASQEAVFRALARLRARRIVRTERGRVLILDAKRLSREGADTNR